MKKIIFLIIILVVLGGGYLAYTSWQAAQLESIVTFADCSAKGYPILESYPPRCLTPDGRTLVGNQMASSTAINLADGTYVFDTAASNLLWEGKKKFVTNYVDRGTIKIKNGEAMITNGQIKSGQIIIDMKSLAAQSTGAGGGESKLTEHLKSDDFFNVATYPEAKFILQSVTTDSADLTKITLNGNLTIRDQTAPLAIPATLSTSDNKITLTGEALVNRAQYGVKFGSTSFFKELADNAIIEDEFKLIFTLVAEKK